jgi:heme-degrading monooxygenase HmoA
MSVRLMLFSTVDVDTAKEFEAAFEEVRLKVATVPGHIQDELLSQQDSPGSYLLVSEWSSHEQCVAWLKSPEHEQMTAKMRPYFQRPSELRFYSRQVPADDA